LEIIPKSKSGWNIWWVSVVMIDVPFKAKIIVFLYFCFIFRGTGVGGLPETNPSGHHQGDFPGEPSEAQGTAAGGVR
jgi:hypothetical protein